MNKLGKIALGFIILLIIAVAAIALYYDLNKKAWDGKSCESECVHREHDKGACLWPNQGENLNGVSIGGCFIENSKHCGKKGMCNCYCYDEPIIGGCGGVAPEHINECCEAWARDHGIFTPACVGAWNIRDGECAYACLTEWFLIFPKHLYTIFKDNYYKMLTRMSTLVAYHVKVWCTYSYSSSFASNYN